MDGDWLPQPGGGTVRFLETGADTGGAFFEFEAVLPAGSSGPPPHIHRVEQEAFTVTAGELSVRLGRTWHVVQPGETCTVTPGVVHAFANKSDQETRLVVRENAAAGQLQEQFLILSEAGRIPPLLQLADLNVRHDMSLQLVGLPAAVQHVLWRGLSRIGHLTGRL